MLSLNQMFLYFTLYLSHIAICPYYALTFLAFAWSYQSVLTSVSVCLQGYDNTESSVRKASVFCLVAIYSVIGEELKPHLAQLTGSKVQMCAH